MLGALLLPAIAPAAAGLAIGLWRGMKTSRYAILAGAMIAAIALLAAHLTDLKDPISTALLWSAPFFALGLSGPALWDDWILATITSITSAIVIGFCWMSFLFAFACAHGDCL